MRNFIDKMSKFICSSVIIKCSCYLLSTMLNFFFFSSLFIKSSRLAFDIITVLRVMCLTVWIRFACFARESKICWKTSTRPDRLDWDRLQEILKVLQTFTLQLKWMNVNTQWFLFLFERLSLFWKWGGFRKHDRQCRLSPPTCVKYSVTLCSYAVSIGAEGYGRGEGVTVDSLKEMHGFTS